MSSYPSSDRHGSLPTERTLLAILRSTFGLKMPAALLPREVLRWLGDLGICVSTNYLSEEGPPGRIAARVLQALYPKVRSQ